MDCCCDCDCTVECTGCTRIVRHDSITCKRCDHTFCDSCVKDSFRTERMIDLCYACCQVLIGKAIDSVKKSTDPKMIANASYLSDYLSKYYLTDYLADCEKCRCEKGGELQCMRCDNTFCDTCVEEDRHYCYDCHRVLMRKTIESIKKSTDRTMAFNVASYLDDVNSAISITDE